MNSKDRLDALRAVLIFLIILAFFVGIGFSDYQNRKAKESCYNATHSAKECE